MTIPSSDIDFFGDETLQNTEAAYKALRDIGPIVYCEPNDLYVVAHYDAVRAALRADDILINGKGVAANELINSAPPDATLTSDGETHNRRRAILMRPLGPRAIHDISDRISGTADQLVQDLKTRKSFCGVKDFASHLPVSIVAELVGLTEDGRENMLSWAAATFDALGPLNERAQNALPMAGSLLHYTAGLTPDQVRSDGWAGRILAEADAGTITPAEATMMVVDYVAPSLDTTILASAQLLWSLGTTPGAFDQLKADPSLVNSAVNEAVRRASPIRAFTRFADTDYVTDYGTIPAGSRVPVMYASANWDERHYQNPQDYQIDRNPRDHVGWGHGAHTCAGMHLARAEMEALCRALIKHASSIQVAKPERILNNVLQGFSTFESTID
ncbi:MAG: cytochrome P450 [Pseudomonadota bacterium]